MGARPPSNNPNRPTGQQPTDRMQSIRTLLNLCPLRHSSESTAVVVKVALQAADNKSSVPCLRRECGAGRPRTVEGCGFQIIAPTHRRHVMPPRTAIRRTSDNALVPSTEAVLAEHASCQRERAEVEASCQIGEVVRTLARLMAAWLPQSWMWGGSPAAMHPAPSWPPPTLTCERTVV